MLTIGNLNIPNFPLLLAPMEDVSDPPFRAVCKENGADLMYTEFISSEALIRDAARSVAKLDIFEYEKPIGIQIFGHNIEVMRESVEITERVQPDIIDINYGCPVKKVTCKGAGAGILQDIPKMVKMTAEMVKATTLPVTVKTRLGWDDNTKYIVEVAERLQDVFGNGDVDSPQKAERMRQQYGVDGIMIGRAAIGNPWIFNEIKHYFAKGELLPAPTIDERIAVYRKHLDFSIKWKGLKLGLLEMRRHYTNYFKGIPHVKPFRTRLVTCDSYDGVLSIVEELRQHAYRAEEHEEKHGGHFTFNPILN